MKIGALTQDITPTSAIGLLLEAGRRATCRRPMVTRPALMEMRTMRAERGITLGSSATGGQRPRAASTYGYTWDDRRDRYVYGNHTELTAEQFDASVMVQVSSP